MLRQMLSLNCNGARLLIIILNRNFVLNFNELKQFIFKCPSLKAAPPCLVSPGGTAMFPPPFAAPMRGL